MTKHDLLLASKHEFEDKQLNAVAWTTKRILIPAGFEYIILETPKKISCALHYNRYFEADEVIGKYENNDWSLNTETELYYKDVVEYKGMYFAIDSAGNWNAEMNFFHYKCSGSFTPIQNQFLIKNEDEIDYDIGMNSMKLFFDLKLRLKYPLIPSHYNVGSLEKYAMITCENEMDFTPVYERRINGELYLEQRKVDNVEISMVNFNRGEAYTFINTLMEHSTSGKPTFGFMTTPTLGQHSTYQKSFNWKSLSYISKFQINYMIRTKAEEKSYNTIKEVFYESLGVF